jgi:hypothetical protein
MTYRILRDVVPEALRTPVLRLIHTDLRYRGLSSRELDCWGQVSWPHLEHLAPVQTIAAWLDDVLDHPGELSRPLQIVWTLPQDAPDGLELTPHTDVPPAGREFALIAGVALSDWSGFNGCVRVWEHGPQGIPCPIALRAGDVVTLTPDTLHSPGVNWSGEIRSGVYVRWMKPFERG